MVVCLQFQVARKKTRIQSNKGCKEQNGNNWGHAIKNQNLVVTVTVHQGALSWMWFVFDNPFPTVQEEVFMAVRDRCDDDKQLVLSVDMYRPDLG